MIAPPTPTVVLDDIRHGASQPYDETWEAPAVDTREAARLLGRTTKEVLRMLMSGVLQGYRTGNKAGCRWYVYRWSIERVLRGHAAPVIAPPVEEDTADLATDAETIAIALMQWAANVRAKGGR